MARRRKRSRDRQAQPGRAIAVAQSVALQALIRLALFLPYRWRVRAAGRFVAAALAPLLGWRKRVSDNLAHVRPDLPAAEVKRMQRAVADNVGRTFIENFSTEDFLARAVDTPVHGAGLDTLERAREARRPVILATAHFGNHEAGRAALTRRGFQIGGLYRPLTNDHFNAAYRKTMEAFGGPVVPQGRRGTAEFIRALKAGGMMVLLYDVHVPRAARMDFLGRPALTAFSAAELALRYDALLIPFFATRQPDGLSFDVEVEAPVPAGKPRAMTEELNRRLEARIDTHMEQWFWVHRRWKRTQPKPGRRPHPEDSEPDGSQD